LDQAFGDRSCFDLLDLEHSKGEERFVVILHTNHYER